MYLVYFHNVLTGSFDAFDRATPRLTDSEFEQQLGWLKQRYRIIDFDECLERLEEGKVDEQVVALSFDDGHLGIFRYAYPILKSLGVTAGVFLLDASGTPAPEEPLLHFESLEIAFRLTKKCEIERYGVAMPTEQRRAIVFEGARQRLKALPDDLRQQRQARLIDDLEVDRTAITAYASTDERFAKLGPAEQQQLSAAGWVFGGHTRSHRVLSRLSDAEIDHEVAIPLNLAEQRHRFTPFAYPYGGADHCNERVAQHVREAGYDYAFTTIPEPILGVSLNSPYLLPRLSFGELKRITG